MVEIHQSVARRVMLKLYQTGTTTPATGATVAVVLSKNGAAFGNPSAGATNATELANGWYFVDLSTTDTNTLGDLVVRGTATGADDAERIFAVVAATNRGMTALPAAAADAAGGLPISDAGGLDMDAILSGINNLATVEDVRTEMDSNSTQFAAIVADTNELQTDWANGGRLDLLVDGILEDTGTTIPALFPANFSTVTIASNAVLANLQAATQTQIDGIAADADHLVNEGVSVEAGGIVAGSFAAGAIVSGTFGAGAITSTVAPNLDVAVSTRSSLAAADVRTAVGLASANLDTQLAALDTLLDTIISTSQSEPTGVPVATAAPLVKLAWLFKTLIRGFEVTATDKTFLSSSGTAEWKKSLSDDGTTYTEATAAAP